MAGPTVNEDGAPILEVAPTAPETATPAATAAPEAAAPAAPEAALAPAPDQLPNGPTFNAYREGMGRGKNDYKNDPYHLRKTDARINRNAKVLENYLKDTSLKDDSSFTLQEHHKLMAQESPSRAAIEIVALHHGVDDLDALSSRKGLEDAIKAHPALADDLNSIARKSAGSLSSGKGRHMVADLDKIAATFETQKKLAGKRNLALTEEGTGARITTISGLEKQAKKRIDAEQPQAPTTEPAAAPAVPPATAAGAQTEVPLAVQVANDPRNSLKALQASLAASAPDNQIQAAPPTGGAAPAAMKATEADLGKIFGGRVIEASKANDNRNVTLLGPSKDNGGDEYFNNLKAALKGAGLSQGQIDKITTLKHDISPGTPDARSAIFIPSKLLVENIGKLEAYSKSHGFPANSASALSAKRDPGAPKTTELETGKTDSRLDDAGDKKRKYVDEHNTDGSNKGWFARNFQLPPDFGSTF